MACSNFPVHLLIHSFHFAFSPSLLLHIQLCTFLLPIFFSLCLSLFSVLAFLFRAILFICLRLCAVSLPPPTRSLSCIHPATIHIYISVISSVCYYVLYAPLLLCMYLCLSLAPRFSYLLSSRRPSLTDPTVLTPPKSLICSRFSCRMRIL